MNLALMMKKELFACFASTRSFVITENFMLWAVLDLEKNAQASGLVMFDLRHALLHRYKTSTTSLFLLEFLAEDTQSSW